MFLLGSLAHFSALALEAASSLLLPLPAHLGGGLFVARGFSTAVEVEEKLDRRAVDESVVLESSDCQGRSTGHEALHVARNKVRVLDEFLKTRNRHGRVDLHHATGGVRHRQTQEELHDLKRVLLPLVTGNVTITVEVLNEKLKD